MFKRLKLLLLTAVCLLIAFIAIRHNQMHVLAQQGSTNNDNGDPVLVGAGDIASCGLNGDELTAKLLDKIPGTVFTAGDNAYENGSTQEFQKCYNTTWGRYKSRTYPAPGNHEYNTKNALPYFAYFGKRAGEPGKPAYSYDLGAWHIISLDSDIDMRPEGGQGQWLKADLEAHKTVCTLVYWHHPAFSSALAAETPRLRETWKLLYAYGVDVIVNGHVHWYERTKPLDPNGNVNPVKGIRQFTVGTGGATLGKKIVPLPDPRVEARDASTWGVIKFVLHPTSYSWEFIPVEGGKFHDSGAADCIGAPQQDTF